MIDAKILVIDDNKSMLSALEILLQFEYKYVATLSNPNQITSYPGFADLDIVLLDMNFSAGVNSGNEGLFWLNQIKEKAPYISVIMMTAYGSIDLAVKAIKNGAVDFILKPWSNERMLATVRSAHQLRKSQKQVIELQKKEHNLKQVINHHNHAIIGQSDAIKVALKLTRKVAQTDVNILVTGENGTGKELIAREIHRCSKRSEEIFIGVDMGSISETLFESELFGHMKGAFTDAKEERTGKIEAADGGTLFLDEIGNLSLKMQTKLLSAIQNRTIVKVGSNKSVSVDIRLICATNCDLEKMVTDGLFREDLMYRINTIQVDVPPLRNRGEDIIILCQYFLEKFMHKYGKPGLRMNQSSEEKLMKYKWPGNVRELQHTMERAVILSEGNVLKPSDFFLNSAAISSFDSFPGSLEEMEALMIEKTLKECDGNYTLAAERLGISRQTLYNKVKKSRD
ncbi:sigma-54 dependent transcriptional regulator [uncultured Cyclobacterium sp.]|uniref:sigma-54-dependent transcriptional regulator n=1 Tax=uncultured Cyclobacterium sp. TaxID=453820 RepID=UPI0030EB4B31|tara:strand:- start:50931 stop:52295 length:1365 start_codon:yes stop_codon:yes gene_type:complete